MTTTKNRTFAHNPRFNFITEEDRYYLKKGDPKYKFNVIGTGTNGQEHIYVTLLEGRAEIHGIYDPHPESQVMAQVANDKLRPDKPLVVYETLEAACQDPAVDGLIICTPNYTHLNIVKEAVKSGKHILLEKPIATNVQDAFTIAQIAEEYPAIFQIGLQYRYKAICTEAIYEALERRSVGNIKMVNILEHRIPFLDKVGQWNKFTKFSGDTLVEKCCHYFDLLNLFAQSRPVNVYASGSMAVNFTDFEYAGEKSDILDNALVIVNYANGVRASFNLCMFSPLIYEELTICGDDGYLRATEREDFLPQSRSGNSLEILSADNKPTRHITPNYPAIIEHSGHGGATFYEHVAFIDNIEGAATNTATAQDGLWSIIVAAAAQESIKCGGVVDIEAFLKANKLEI